jgi:hypothetical protein
MEKKPVRLFQPPLRAISAPTVPVGGSSEVNIGNMYSTLWRSHGNPVNRNTGKRESGGAFHVTHSGPFVVPGHVTNIVGRAGGESYLYSGPVIGDLYESASMMEHYDGETDDLDENRVAEGGTTAIALVAPTNPTANLGVTLAETIREGIPSLPGIQSWKHRTEALRAAGSEYLNYQFGWAPLHSEVKNTVNAARHHRDILHSYRNGEGNNIHRRFDFDDEVQTWDEEISPQNPISGILNTSFVQIEFPPAERVVRVENRRKRWFEGCFTYGGPSGVDSFGRAMGYGSDADKLYGLTLSPDVLWNLTPWSWAVDWFTNTGDLIHNVTNFAMAGLVMRYGYMMEETISTYSVEWDDAPFNGIRDIRATPKQYYPLFGGSGSRGLVTTTKSRVPANPFGFGVGWEGLSPTQLAITAAIGITRFL